MAAQLAKEQKEKLKGQLIKARAEIELRAPKHIRPELFIGAAMTAVTKNPNLLLCDRISLFNALFMAVQCGLIPDTPLQHAHLIPFKKTVVFVPGYRGLIVAAYRNPRITYIDTGAVYKNEIDAGRFKAVKGGTPSLTHDPIYNTADRGELSLVYALAWLKDMPYPIFHVMDMKDVERIKQKSPSKKAGVVVGPWKDDFLPMALKTVLKQLTKLLPIESEQATIIQADNQAEIGEKQLLEGEWADIDVAEIVGIETVPTSEQKPATRSAALADKLKKEKPKDEPPPTETTELGTEDHGEPPAEEPASPGPGKSEMGGDETDSTVDESGVEPPIAMDADQRVTIETIIKTKKSPGKKHKDTLVKARDYLNSDSITKDDADALILELMELPDKNPKPKKQESLGV